MTALQERNVGFRSNQKSIDLRDTEVVFAADLGRIDIETYGALVDAYVAGQQAERPVHDTRIEDTTIRPRRDA